MKRSLGFVTGVLLFLISFVVINRGTAGNSTAASLLFLASLLIIGITELSMKMGKK